MYRLMVVDDEALIRQGLLARLEFLGFSFEQVQEAGGGTEALKILEKSPVDICIVDIQMPDLDGLTFIERAKKHGGGKYTVYPVERVCGIFLCGESYFSGGVGLSAETSGK